MRSATGGWCSDGWCPGGLLLLVACGVLLLATAPVAAQHGTQGGEWRSYGGDVGSTKYSPLDLITRDNFEQLEEAFTPALDAEATSYDELGYEWYSTDDGEHWYRRAGLDDEWTKSEG